MKNELIVDELYIDFDEPYYKKPVMKQGDTARVLIIYLSRGGQPVDLTGDIVRCYFVKADNTDGYIAPGTMSNLATGKIAYAITSNMLAVVGTIKVEISVINSNKVITSRVFSIEVEKTIRNDLAIESSNEYTALIETESRLGNKLVELDSKSGQLETLYTDRLNALEGIGLDNLIENSDFQFDLNGWAAWSSTTVLSIDQMKNEKCCKVKANADNVSSLGINYVKKGINFIKDTMYSLSFYMESSANVSAAELTYSYIMMESGTGNQSIRDQNNYTYKTYKINDRMFRVVMTFSPKDDFSNSGIMIGTAKAGILSTTGFKINKIHLSKGNIAPSYVHSWKDVAKEVANKIATAKTKINNGIENQVATKTLIASTRIGIDKVFFTTDNTDLYISGLTGGLIVNGKRVEQNIGAKTTLNGSYTGQYVKERYLGNGNYIVYVSDFFTKAGSATEMSAKKIVLPANLYATIDNRTAFAQVNDRNSSANALFATVDLCKIELNNTTKQVEITLQFKNISASEGVVYVDVHFEATK